MDPRLHAALTDLHAFVLVLDAERQRLITQLELLAKSDAASPRRSLLERQRCEISEELGALRATIAALRVQANPESDQP